jgi:hypothetical protein
VPVTVFPQVTFTEPVVNVPAGVTLVDADGAPVPFTLLGVGPDGPVTDVQAATPITSLTIQPLTGLKYATTYTLRLSADITDLDEAPDGTPARKALIPYETSFTTFAPQGIGQTAEQFTSGGLAIVGDRTYVAQHDTRATKLRVFDVSDPVQPTEIVGPDNPASFILHRPSSRWARRWISPSRIDQPSWTTDGSSRSRPTRSRIRTTPPTCGCTT